VGKFKEEKRGRNSLIKRKIRKVKMKVERKKMIKWSCDKVTVLPVPYKPRNYLIR
jgi:hypothetical protein